VLHNTCQFTRRSLHHLLLSISRDLTRLDVSGATYTGEENAKNIASLDDEVPTRFEKHLISNIISCLMIPQVVSPTTGN